MSSWSFESEIKFFEKSNQQIKLDHDQEKKGNNWTLLACAADVIELQRSITSATQARTLLM